MLLVVKTNVRYAFIRQAGGGPARWKRRLQERTGREAALLLVQMGRTPGRDWPGMEEGRRVSSACPRALPSRACTLGVRLHQHRPTRAQVMPARLRANTLAFSLCFVLPSCRRPLKIV